MGGQLRAVPGAVLGWDLGAGLAMAAAHGVPVTTTAAAALAAARGMADWSRHELRVRTLQEYHRGVNADQLSFFP